MPTYEPKPAFEPMPTYEPKRAYERPLNTPSPQ